MGNLGVDLLLLVLTPLFGLEPAVKLIVLAIPPLTAAGFLWVAREVHGRIPPTAFFALPFIYGFPFLFGFVNFALSVALAFLAFGLWLRLGRLERTTLREWLFVPISIIIFFCHTYGWGLLGLMCFSADAVRLHDRGRSWFRAGLEAALHTSVMALPLAAMLLSPIASHGASPPAGSTGMQKWTGSARHACATGGASSTGAVGFAALIFLFALASPELRLARSLALSRAVLAASFYPVATLILASAYSDMRLSRSCSPSPCLHRACVAAGSSHLGHLLAVLGFLFFAVRLGGTTASLAIAARRPTANLKAIDLFLLAPGSRPFMACPTPSRGRCSATVTSAAWSSLAANGFSNDQWITTSHNLLVLRYRAPGSFASNPSQVVRPKALHGPPSTARSTKHSRRSARQIRFYLADQCVLPRTTAWCRNLRLVWRGPGRHSYRIPKPIRPVNTL